MATPTAGSFPRTAGNWTWSTIFSGLTTEAPGHHNVLFYRRFNNMFCPKLKGKPKFFLIQACRGDDVDFGLSPDISTVLKLEDTDSRKAKSPPLLASRPRSLTFPEMLTRANKVTTVYKQWLTVINRWYSWPGTHLGGHGHRLLHNTWLRVEQRQGEGDLVHSECLQG